jgi:hypothetical protein
MMIILSRRYVWSLLIGVALTLLIGIAASVGNGSAIGVLLFPGTMLAAIVFPAVIHSDLGTAYLVLAGLIESVVLGLVTLWWWTLIDFDLGFASWGASFGLRVRVLLRLPPNHSRNPRFGQPRVGGDVLTP